MTPFTRLQAIAAPLPLANVDTDKILPARFLKTISRSGLAVGLFHSLRQDPDFILNRAPWDQAGILIALDNFGCGSSREHAPWALLDFGIRCVIAPSIADIFYNNCFKNGILPIVLPQADIDALMALAAVPETAELRIDLERQTVQAASGQAFAFAIDAKRKQDLMLGIDDIARTLTREAEIAAFEQELARREPWLPGITQADLLS